MIGEIFDKDYIVTLIESLGQLWASLDPTITLDSVTLVNADMSGKTIPSSELDANTLRFPTVIDAWNRISSNEKGSQVVSVHSPVRLMIVDSGGRRVGEGADGRMAYDIPGAFFLKSNGGSLAYLPPGIGEYEIELTGTASGEYRFVVAYASDGFTTRDMSGSVSTGQTLTYSVTSSDGTVSVVPSGQVSGQQDIVLTLTSAVVTAVIVLVSSEILLRRRRRDRNMGARERHWRESVGQVCPGCHYEGHIPERNGVGECPSCHRKIYYS
jgi:hypothetical protein